MDQHFTDQSPLNPDPYGKADVSEEVIGGYRLLKHLVTGQASQVWEVRDASGRHFAMKLLLPEKVSNAQFRHFLLHEADVGKELAHPNIIRIVNVGNDKKNPYFVMEFFPAGNLKMRIQRKETPFIREKGQEILKQIATGLAFMNAKGWVHRDIKPDNILVNSAGEVKLIDFAIAQPHPDRHVEIVPPARQAAKARAAICLQSKSAVWKARTAARTFTASPPRLLNW